MSNFERWYNVGDYVKVSRNMRAKGFLLKEGTNVKVVDFHSVDDSRGGWSYSIEVTNPRTKETYILYSWVSQFDIFSPRDLEKYERRQEEMKRQDEEIARLNSDIARLKGLK